jgi:hypothetical protein
MLDQVDAPDQRQRPQAGPDANQNTDESPFPKIGGPFADFRDLSWASRKTDTCTLSNIRALAAPEYCWLLFVLRSWRM